MNDDCDLYKKALQEIARLLDGLDYECNSSIYTLDDDEMGWVFYCRDLAQKTLKEVIQKNEQ